MSGTGATGPSVSGSARGSLSHLPINLLFLGPFRIFWRSHPCRELVKSSENTAAHSIFWEPRFQISGFVSPWPTSPLRRWLRQNTLSSIESNVTKNNRLSIEKRRPPRHDQRSIWERFFPRTMVVYGREFFAKRAFDWYEALATWPPYHPYLDIHISLTMH